MLYMKMCCNRCQRRKCDKAINIFHLIFNKLFCCKNSLFTCSSFSRKRGAGKQTIFTTKKLVKDEMKNIDRFITLSPLTPIATHFHIKHGAKLVNINATSQNFEYDFN